RAFAPPIPGLAEAGYLTNETVFGLTERPARLAIIGGGPIGCEMAQAFRRLGSDVVLFHNREHILNREDADAAAIVQRQFLREHICLLLNTRIVRVSMQNGNAVLHFDRPQGSGDVAVDAILVAAGRTPNIESLNLEAIGVQYDQRTGIVVNDHLQTTNPAIYAAGDVCMKHQFTHAADAAARIVIRNTLFLGHDRLSNLVMPWCTYTEPEIAHVGLYAHEAEQQGMQVETIKVDFEHVDRAITDGDEEGFVKMHIKKGSDQIVGATIVARNAGDMISEVTLAIVGNLGLKTLATVIHPYPTQAEAIRKVADAYNRTRLTPTVKTVFHQWLAWNR
ncbi:MAG: FAD-dependent oxidoreductase, partial [Chloroflexaceae bacterium]|nr:FAD-dependent oxidoreductase [Chloroflexaceae bacterium]